MLSTQAAAVGQGRGCVKVIVYFSIYLGRDVF